MFPFQQRDRVIREQSHIIRFLTKKTGTKRSDILTLADEAVSKIPQWNEEEEEGVEVEKSEKNPSKDIIISKAKSETTLTSILESESENDSAIILDDLASPTSAKSVSRSVSDVMSSETSEEIIDKSPFASSNYRGFLLRHGSYERYKIRSRMQQLQHQHHHHQQHSHHTQPGDYAQIAANATLPRNKKKNQSNQDNVGPTKTPYAVSHSLGKELSSNSSTTVIVINGCNNNNNNNGSNEVTTNTATTTSSKPNSNHRNVTKPRDVKNKSNRTKMILRMNHSPPNSKSPSPPIMITDKLIQQSGSVYCSLFSGDLSDDSYA